MAKKIEPKKRPKKNGRPLKEIDMIQLAAFCRLKPSKADCAAFFKCTERTIDRVIEKHTGLAFGAFRDQNLVFTRFELIRDAIRKAKHSDTMHIFTLKNLCNWTDKLKTESEDTVTFLAEQSDEALEERIKVLEAKREKLKLTEGE